MIARKANGAAAGPTTMVTLQEDVRGTDPRAPAHASNRNERARSMVMTRQVISSGGPLEQTYGYSRAVRVGAHVHVAGTAARGEALGGDAYVQTQNILGTIRSALEQAGARVEDVVRTVIYVTAIDDAESALNSALRGATNSASRRRLT